eukprot:2694832-Alexandrium_andersonii.AAC.1
MSANGASSPRPAPRRTQKVGSAGNKAAGWNRPPTKPTTSARASSHSCKASMAFARVGVKAMIKDLLRPPGK